MTENLNARLTNEKISTTDITDTIAHQSAHLLTAAALLLAIHPRPIPPMAWIMAGIAALLPDVADMALGLPHRTITHSIAGWLYVTLAAYAADPPDIPAVMPVAIGYGSHILLDLTHGLGVQLLYPSRRMYAAAPIAPTNIAIGAIAAIILLLPSSPPLDPARIYPPTPTPTLTRTPTPSPTLTPAVTLTSTPNYAAAIDWAQYQQAQTAADIACAYNGQRSPACKMALSAAQIALLKWCSTSRSDNPILCPIPTSTPAPTATRTPLTTPTLQVPQH